ncbi:MAG: hypothetical protein COV70_00060 [Parcubacteria group bacterium CG11_big_fil_rev_8_21_14_0_20_39_22]|nr:MAG: hypothetical protein COV70_00060 [Parcubacteria group bacterium CG11_big_fil_rev_8_21_14_0_20_39_22]
MEFWILLVVVAQFFQAIVVLLDKYLVSSPEIPRPAVYAFYIGILSFFPIVLVPFGIIHLPSQLVIELALLVAGTYIGALIFLYSSLKVADATDVAPFLGAVTAASTFGFSFFILGSELPRHFFLGVVLLVVGMLFVAHLRFNLKALFFVICSGLLFAVSSVCIKLMFNNTDFINAFFWSRMGNVLGALLLLLWPPVLFAVFSGMKKSTNKIRSLVIGNKVLSGTVFLLLLWAINIGDVSVVNALTGLQFVFLFIIVIALGKRRPKYIKEVLRPGHILHKVVAIILITSGLFVLFL